MAAGKGRISFGLEIELLVAYRYQDEPEPQIPKGIVTENNVPVLVVPRTTVEGFGWEPTSSRFAKSAINHVLAAHGFRDDPQREAKWRSSFHSTHDFDNGELGLERVYEWRCDTESLDELQNRCVPHLRFAPVELKSPAMWSEVAESFEEVGLVLNLLRNHFKLRINPRCGLHVHIGTGFVDGFPEEPPVLKRLAALAWAVDPVMSAVHAPERAINHWCPSIRLFSKLSQMSLSLLPPVPDINEKPLVALFGAEQRPTRAQLWHLDPLPSARRWVARRRAAAQRLPTVRPVKLDHDNDAVVRRMEDHAVHTRYPQYRPETRTTIAGCATLLAAPSGREAAALLAAPSLADRLNMHFGQFGDAVLRELREVRGYKATIEFREAAGSIDAAWIAVWVRITAGIVRFAWDAPDEDLGAVLARLAEAQGEIGGDGVAGQQPDPVPYDAIDFLDDIGLAPEAEFLERTDCQKRWYPFPNIQDVVRALAIRQNQQGQDGDWQVHSQSH